MTGNRVWCLKGNMAVAEHIQNLIDPGPPPPGQDFFPIKWNKSYEETQADLIGVMEDV